MSRRKLPRDATLTDLANHMLTQPMPASDEVRDCLTELGVRPTCGAAVIFGMIQRAAGGDTSAAKFLKEICGEGASRDEGSITDLRRVSDAVLCRLAGMNPGDLMGKE